MTNPEKLKMFKAAHRDTSRFMKRIGSKSDSVHILLEDAFIRGAKAALNGFTTPSKSGSSSGSSSGSGSASAGGTSPETVQTILDKFFGKGASGITSGTITTKRNKASESTSSTPSGQDTTTSVSRAPRASTSPRKATPRGMLILI